MVILLGILIYPLFLLAQNGTYVINTERSTIGFKVTHLGAFRVEGDFDKFSGEMVFQNDEVDVIRCIIDVGSINTNNDERDGILRSEPYFDIENFPEIIYWADNLSKESQGPSLHGRLKIKNEENYLSFPVELDYDKIKDEITLNAETEISRKFYKLIFGSMNSLIGDTVSISLSIIALNR